jgi:integrase
MTVDTLLTLWMADTDRRVDLAERTKLNYLWVSNVLRSWGGDRELEGLDLTAFVIHRRSQGIGERRILLELRAMNIATNWARRTGQLERGFELVVPKLKPDPNTFVVNHATPTPEEAGKAVAAMDLDDWRLAVALLARTGARVGEVLALRSRDLDAHRGLLTLGATRGNRKTGARLFPLDAQSLQELRGRGGRGHEPLFDFGRVTKPIQGLRKRLLEACRRAGVTPFTPHGLRRMVVGRLIRARVDPGTAASLTGHSVTVMLRHYQVVTDEDRREATERAALGDLRGP